MAYIEKEIGEKLIERMYKSVKVSNKNLDKLIEENKEFYTQLKNFLKI